MALSRAVSDWTEKHYLSMRIVLLSCGEMFFANASLSWKATKEALFWKFHGIKGALNRPSGLVK